MPTGSVGHQENETVEIRENDNVQHPPALPISEPPQLFDTTDKDRSNTKEEKKTLQVDNSNLIEEATRELDENGNELPKQLPTVVEQINRQHPQQKSTEETSKTNYLIRLLSILRSQFRSKRASYELQSRDEPPCGAGLRFWNRGKDSHDCRRRDERLSAVFSNINNEPGTNVQIRYRITDSL